MKLVKQKAVNRNWLYVFATDFEQRIQTAHRKCRQFYALLLFYAGGENGASSAITERALLPVTNIIDLVLIIGSIIYNKNEKWH